LLPLLYLAFWGVVILFQLFGVNEYGRLHSTGDALYNRSMLIEEKIIFPSAFFQTIAAISISPASHSIQHDHHLQRFCTYAQNHQAMHRR
jgi:hypothetical protein